MDEAPCHREIETEPLPLQATGDAPGRDRLGGVADVPASPPVEERARHELPPGVGAARHRDIELHAEDLAGIANELISAVPAHRIDAPDGERIDGQHARLRALCGSLEDRLDALFADSLHILELPKPV